MVDRSEATFEHMVEAPKRPLVLLLALLAACGREDPFAPPSRVRLVDVAEGRLEQAAPEPAETILCEDFGRGWDGWIVVADPSRPLDVEGGMLEPAIEREAGRSFLALRGRQGGLYRIVPAESNAFYAFSVLVRSRGVDTSAERFYGAAPWLAELAQAVSAEALFALESNARVIRRHVFSSARGEEGWQERRLVFRTGPRTRGLAVVCFLAFLGEVEAGSADFAELELRRLPERLYWEEILRDAAADTWKGEPEPSGWRAERLVRASLGAEVRPSIVCLPGESVSIRVRLPQRATRLESGVGPWLAARSGSVALEQVFVIRADGREVLRQGITVPAEAADARWREVEIDLSAQAGKTVELELAVEGDLPGAFGAPAVRDASATPSVPNVLLVSIDTLRADHVGCYGYEGNTTPNLDAFAREGVLFRHVAAQAPYTVPSHATLFSGQFPSIHGVERPTRLLSSVRSPILAQILARAGYRTQAFTGGGYLNADFGFDKGFDGFSNIDPLRARDSRVFGALVAQARRAEQRGRLAWDPPVGVTAELIREYGPERVLSWLEAHANEPFFLFVHTFVVHDYDAPPGGLTCSEQGCTSARVDPADYVEFQLRPRLGQHPRPIDDADREHLLHLYDAAIRHVDGELGRILERLDALDLSKRTVVVITSDHGEEIFERGFVQHGKTLFEELVRVPLVLKIPGRAPLEVERAVMLADVAPTILGALGFPPDGRMQGVDLLGGKVGERMLWSEVDGELVNKYALQDPSGWKVIHAPPERDLLLPAEREWSLYHLPSDPAEHHDLAEKEGHLLEGLRNALEQERASLREISAGLDAVGSSELSEETLLQLRELGYVE